jgi:hypothetical protein
MFVRCHNSIAAKTTHGVIDQITIRCDKDLPDKSCRFGAFIDMLDHRLVEEKGEGFSGESGGLISGRYNNNSGHNFFYDNIKDMHKLPIGRESE